MATIALVAGPDPGHALPVIGVGTALRRRGHRVDLWTGRRHATLAARSGLRWHELPLLAAQPGDHDLGTRLHARSVGMARALAPQVAAAGPDLLVADTLTRAGALAAALVGVPLVEVVPHHLPDPARDLPPLGLGRPLPRTPWRRADDRQLVRRQLASVAQGAAQAAAAAQAVGLPAWPTPQLRLLQTLPSLERRRQRWPDDAVVAGCLAVDPDLPLLAPPDGEAPLVVVSDTTADGNVRSLADAATVGLRGLDLRVVVTTAQRPPSRAPGMVVGVGPHGPLLAGAALVVSPGGGGTVTKAGAAGVPHLTVPLAGDQREAAARLLDAAAGRRLRASRCTPRTLRWAVVRALADPRLRAGAQRLADEARTLGPELAADRCLAVLAGADPAGAGGAA